MAGAVPGCCGLHDKERKVCQVCIFLDFVRRSGTTRTEGPHGGASYVRGAKRNRIGPLWGVVERFTTRTARRRRTCASTPRPSSCGTLQVAGCKGETGGKKTQGVGNFLIPFGHHTCARPMGCASYVHCPAATRTRLDRDHHSAFNGRLPPRSSRNSTKFGRIRKGGFQ